MNNTTDLVEKLRRDPRVDEFFGKCFVLKLAVLQRQTSGVGTIAEIARRYGVTRQAVNLHAIEARRLFGKSS
jgi:hypothetical protein